MKFEERLPACVLDTDFDDLSDAGIEIGKRLVLTVLGTTLAGASVEGCKEVLEQVREWGGRLSWTAWFSSDTRRVGLPHRALTRFLPWPGKSC
jgi:hypothetical protein